jgi:tape measure domain-containing protein
MAEYRLEFEANSGAAERSISNLRKSIGEITKEFEKSEIGAEDFIKAAGEISRLKKEYNDARNAVANIDKAYRDLNKAIEANFAVHTKATNEASKYHKNLLRLAEDSFRAEDKLRDKNFQAEQDDWDRRLAIAVAAKNKIAAQQKAIMEFRAGMGTRGAIPAVASPVRGSAQQFGSPEYFDALNRDLKQAIDEGRQLDVEIKKAAESRNRAIAEFRSGMAGRGAISGVASPIRGGADIMGSPDFLQPQSLGRLQNQLTKLKEEARRISPDSDKWRAINKEAITLERGIERIQKRQKLGPTAGQRAGAAGGAFLYGGGMGGGVGSALGGVAGGLAGGVPGAFAGAALGQLSDNIGQALGATASYTAEIDKQRIALKNVTKDVAEYQNALAFIDRTSRDLAIPQDVLNKQFTQLSASVIGAGGDINLAQEAFIGIAAGIRGTGGSLADMEGALRATAQVFSKGKVSAEELRQQIGERLPGAFTLFAKSMGKTPQELDKMLEQGQVTLNDFMGFVRTLSAEYGASASEIAASSQAAGDRLATTMSRMREAVGRELQPLGAQFQEIIANVVADNEGNLVALAKAFSQAAQAIGGFIEKYGELIASLASTVLLFGGTILAVKGIGIAFAAIGPAITTASAAIAGYGGVMATLKLAIAGLGGPITLTIAGLVLLAKGVYDTNETFRNFVENIGGILATDFKNAVDGMASDTRTAASEVENAFDTLKQNLQPIGSFIEKFFEDVFGSVSDDGESSAGNVDNAFTTAFNNILSQGAAAFSGLSALIGNWWNSLPAPIRNILGGNTASILVGAAGYAGDVANRASTPNAQSTGMYGRYGAPESQVDFTQSTPPAGNKPRTFPGSSGGGSSGGKPAKAPKAGKTRESELPLLALELATQKQIFQIESDIRSARLGGNDLEVIRLQGLQQQLKINQQIAELRLDKVTPANEKAVQLQLLLGKAEKERLDNTFEMESQIMQQYQAMQDAVIGIGTAADMELEGRKQYEALLREGMAPTLAKITAEVNQQFAIEKQKLTLLGSQIRDQILVLESKEALTKEDKEQLRILKERLALTEGGVSAIPGLAQGVIEAKAQTAAPKTTEAYLGEGLEEAQANLDKLTNTGYQVVQGANAIGDAFGTAFKNIASGSMTAQEALATMFQSIADHFLDMAAQMIAAWIKMAILNTVIKIFSSGAGGGESAIPTDAGGWADSFKTSLPGLSGDIGRTPIGFAEGGFVAGPTMGLIGEGGESEYIIPSSKMQSAMKRYSGGARGSAVIPANGESSEAGAMPTATGGAIDVRYTVERINTVDYVTADQFQRGMQQAASQGAQQGEKRALRQLQQNTSIRGRVGLR